MALWKNWVKTRRFPNIIKHYQKARLFYKAVLAEANGSAVWARWAPGEPKGGDANLQVDVLAVPKVLPMTGSGKIK